MSQMIGKILLWGLVIAFVVLLWLAFAGMLGGHGSGSHSLGIWRLS